MSFYMIHMFYAGGFSTILGGMPGWVIPISVACALASGRWLTDKFEKPWQEFLREKQPDLKGKLFGCGPGGCWMPVVCLYTGCLCLPGFAHWCKRKHEGGGSNNSDTADHRNAQNAAAPTPARVFVGSE